jgi:hypothetical protein
VVPVGVDDLEPQTLLVRVAKALVVLETEAEADRVAVRMADCVRAVLDTVAVTLGVRDILDETDAVAETVDDGEIRADPEEVAVRLEAVAVIEGVRRGEIVGPGEAVKERVGRTVSEPLTLAVADAVTNPEAEGQAEDV